MDESRSRTRPSAAQWASTMETLLVDHATHGTMPDHVLRHWAKDLGVAMTSLEHRYGEFLRRLEVEAGCVVLDAGDREVIRPAVSLLDAHRMLRRAGRMVPFALFERAVWRDAGDRDLVGLRNAERARRFATRDETRCEASVVSRPKAVAA